MTAIIPFTFESSEIRSIVDAEGNPWFVARDIAKALGYSDPADAVQRHCKKAQAVGIIGVGETPTLQNQTLIIPQSDVIRLISRSKLESAERFQDWLFEEVVPSILKTGSYSARVLTPAEQNLANAQLAVEFERRQTAIEAQQLVTDAKSTRALELATIAEAKAQATVLACQDYSIMAYSRLCNISVDLATARALGVQAGKLSRARGLPIGQARDPRFGSVNTYIESVLQEVFTDGL